MEKIWTFHLVEPWQLLNLSGETKTKLLTMWKLTNILENSVEEYVITSEITKQNGKTWSKGSIRYLIGNTLKLNEYEKQILVCTDSE